MVARAQAAGVGRMVTISTRVRRHAQVSPSPSGFPNVSCSVGTHPHHAHEELDITADDLIARTQPSQGRGDRRGRARLSLRQLAARRAGAGFRNHIAAARETGLPLVIHSREADEDMARILEEEMGKGPFPAVLHCYTGGAGAGAARDRARLLISLHRHRDVQEIGRAARDRQRRCRRTASWSRPTRRISRPMPYRGKRNEPAYVVEIAKVLAEMRGVSFEEIARQTTDNFFRLFAKVPRAGGRPPHDALHASRSSAAAPPAACRGPAPAGAPAIRTIRRTAAGAARCWSSAAAAAASPASWSTPSPDLREQLLDAKVDWLDAVLYTHEHADHTHGIDDLRGLFMHKRQRVLDVYADDATSRMLMTRFGYCFVPPPGSEYPPIAEHAPASRPAQPVTVDGAGGADHGPADPAGPRRHPLARLPLRRGWPIPAT